MKWGLVAAVGRVERSRIGGHTAGKVVTVLVWNSIIKISLFYCKKELRKTRN